MKVGDEAELLAWQVIGIRLQPVTGVAMQRINSRVKQNYRGGLLVTEVRKSSPARRTGSKSVTS